MIERVRWMLVWGVAVLGALCATGSAVGEPYVLISSNRSSVEKFSMDGEHLGTLVEPGSGGLNFAQQMAIGPDGNLYVAGWHSAKVHKYDLETGAFLGIAAQGNGLVRPAYTGFDPQGNLIVTSHTAGRVMRFDPDTGDFLGDAVEAGHVNAPRNVIWDNNGHMLIDDMTANRIRRFDAGTGAYIDDLVVGEGLNSPQGMDFTPGGSSFWVSNWNTGFVLNFDTETGASLGFINTQMSRNDGVHVLNDGSVMVTSYGSNRVRLYDPETGGMITEFSHSTLQGANYAFVVPAPGSIGVLAIGMLCGVRRRRRVS